MTVDTDGLRHAYEKIGDLRAKFLPQTEALLRKHGAIIERNAAPLTPVDKGFLRRASTSDVSSEQGSVTLTLANRMVYASYQHEREDLHHKVGGPHFIRDPFRDEIPVIRRDITAMVLEAAEGGQK